MFTVFDLMTLVTPIAGAWLGFEVGSRVGLAGGAAGAIAGLVLGWIVGRVPFILSVRSVQRSFADLTADDLRLLLRRRDCTIVNLILLELAARGEDIRKELSVVLDLLESDDSSKRGFGWAAMTSAYPDLAARMKGYRPRASATRRRLKVKAFRETLIQDFDDSSAGKSGL
jgi:hypothetical protein